MRKHILIFAAAALIWPAMAGAQTFTPDQEFLPQEDKEFYQGDEFGPGYDDEFRLFNDSSNNDVYLNEYELRLIDEKEKQTAQEKKNREELEQERAIKKKQEEERLKRFYSEKFMIVNIMYGVLTGGLIGAGLAVTVSSDTRSRVSSITTGVMLGAILGAVVGFSHQRQLKEEARTTDTQPISDAMNESIILNYQPLVLGSFEDGGAIPKSMMASKEKSERIPISASFTINF